MCNCGWWGLPLSSPLDIVISNEILLRHCPVIVLAHWALTFPGVRESRHLQTRKIAGRRSPGPGGLLHPPLCGHLREGRHEDPQLRDSTTRGEEFYLRNIGFLFCWAQFFSMVIKLRLWSYFQFSKHFFIFHKIKSSIIILHLVQPRFSLHKNKIFPLNFSLFWVTVLIKGRYKV